MSSSLSWQSIVFDQAFSTTKKTHPFFSGVISNDEELEKLAIKAGLASGDHVMPMIFAPEILCAKACPFFSFPMFPCVRSCPPVLANPPFVSLHKGNPKRNSPKQRAACVVFLSLPVAQ